MIDQFELRDSKTLLETNIFKLLQKNYFRQDGSEFDAILSLVSMMRIIFF